MMKETISAIMAAAVLVAPYSMQSVAAEDVASMQISTVSANAGEDVDVVVELNNNPGIIAMGFTVSYDTEALELISAEDCNLFTDASFTPGGDVTAVPFRLIWSDGLPRDNYTENGEMAVLHFHVLDTAAPGLSEIEINVEDENTFDVDLNDVHFDSVNGGVEIVGGEAVETTTTEETTTAETTTETETTTVEETTKTETTTVEETTETETTTVEETTESETTTVEETTETETTTVEETTETETTTVEETTETQTTTETTAETTPATTINASVEDICSWAMSDYEQKTGVKPAKSVATTNEDGTITIVLNDKKGNVLDTYTIDKATGMGTNAQGETINLPQTGITSPVAATLAIGATAMTAIGSLFIRIFRKRRDD